jgi:CRISPR-associated endonuclease/helicase Cas3
MSNGPYYAHTPPDHDPNRWQTMREHATNVAELAARFAVPFGVEKLARWVGWLHDVGKYSDEFQKYLRDCHKAKLAKTRPPKAGSAEHKCGGTKLVLENNKLPRDARIALAACVLGHHGGLPTAGFELLDNIVARVEEDAKNGVAMLETAIRRAREDCAEVNDAQPKDYSDVTDGDVFTREMMTRFIFSCLVDADSLDTERHFNEDRADLRGSLKFDDVGEQWLQTLKDKQADMVRHLDDQNSNVNQVRREVYEACLAAAELQPGLFSLTVPTGGGKTRSSLAFALAHATRHNLKRIIYAIPYTSIIDQTAAVFRDLLGDDAVLEHHSAVDPRAYKSEDEDDDVDQAEDAREQKRRLDAENWNAPLIVTTTVQLFESLFANKTSRCRKVHHIAKSVIILDEVQTLPPSLIAPLISGLNTLIERFGVTVVLCTATQPALSGKSRYLEGLPPATPIVQPDRTAQHFAELKRVTYRVQPETWSWEQVAAEMKSKPTSCLTVLNTKKDALAVLAALKDGRAYHLSTLLCGAHRKKSLDEIRRALKAERLGGPPVMLVSTQVIEAGVDVDFARVLRAKAPLDRVIQCGGRCNREGERGVSESTVTVFDPVEGGVPPGEYRPATDLAWALVRDNPNFDFDSPNVVTQYFAALYDSLGAGVDKMNVQSDRRSLRFPDVAKKVRLIKDDTVPVLVPYDEEEFEDIERTIRWRVKLGWGMNRELWQRIQPFTVAIYYRELAKLNSVKPLIPDQLYIWRDVYDPVVGIGNGVDRDPSDLIV